MSRLLQSPAAVLKRPSVPNVSESFSHFQDEQPCGRPFCKLKRREHYHCELGNQAFSEAERLHPHLERHADGWQSPQTAAGSQEQQRADAELQQREQKEEQEREQREREQREREQRRSK